MSARCHRLRLVTEIIMAEADRPSPYPYLFLSLEDDGDVTDIGKHDFRSVLLHRDIANQTFLAFYQTRF